jgi:hypothetical protein
MVTIIFLTTYQRLGVWRRYLCKALNGAHRLKNMLGIYTMSTQVGHAFGLGPQDTIYLLPLISTAIGM